MDTRLELMALAERVTNNYWTIAAKKEDSIPSIKIYIQDVIDASKILRREYNLDTKGE